MSEIYKILTCFSVAAPSQGILTVSREGGIDEFTLGNGHHGPVLLTHRPEENYQVPVFSAAPGAEGKLDGFAAARHIPLTDHGQMMNCASSGKRDLPSSVSRAAWTTSIICSSFR